MKKTFTLLVFLLIFSMANSQVLISLLLGDKLNSGKIEFGLDGGWNMSALHTKGDTTNITHGFNLGFYFDFKLKNPKWMVHTGVIVKSPMGAKGMPVYSLGDTLLDSVFVGGSVARKIRYFNVPVMIKYMFIPHFYVEGGFMLGLGYKAFDEFTNTVVNKDDISYDLKIIKQVRKIDAGAMAGVGYRLDVGYGLNLGVRYYYGLVNVMLDKAAPKQYNRGIYVVAEIPIGAGKAKKNAEKKAADQKSAGEKSSGNEKQH